MRKIPKLLDMIGQLIATPSVSCVNPALDQGNRDVIELLARWLEKSGFNIEIMDTDQSNKANLIATLGSGPGGLVLAGHTDTVPYDEGKWRHNPFKLAEADGRLYGLGTSDMKAFLALAIEAALSFDPKDIKQPLIILATADEETSMCGAKALVATGRPKARYAVIGEPTDMKPIRMHKGMMMESVRLIGRSGHSSDPSLGVNALEAMHLAMGELLSWREELQSRYRNPLFAVPVTTLNLGHIHGGDNPNRICGECELHIDIRPLPGLTLEELRAEMENRLQQILKSSGVRMETHSLFEGIPAVETPAASPIVTAAEQLTGHHAGSVAFATEAPYLTQLGIDTVVLGPGSIKQAHQPDEYLEIANIAPTVELLKSLIGRFCLSPGQTLNDRQTAEP